MALFETVPPAPSWIMTKRIKRRSKFTGAPSIIAVNAAGGAGTAGSQGGAGMNA